MQSTIKNNLTVCQKCKQ